MEFLREMRCSSGLLSCLDHLPPDESVLEDGDEDDMWKNLGMSHHQAVLVLPGLIGHRMRIKTEVQRKRSLPRSFLIITIIIYMYKMCK